MKFLAITFLFFFDLRAQDLYNNQNIIIDAGSIERGGFGDIAANFKIGFDLLDNGYKGDLVFLTTNHELEKMQSSYRDILPGKNKIILNGKSVEFYIFTAVDNLNDYKAYMKKIERPDLYIRAAAVNANDPLYRTGASPVSDEAYSFRKLEARGVPQLEIPPPKKFISLIADGRKIGSYGILQPNGTYKTSIVSSIGYDSKNLYVYPDTDVDYVNTASPQKMETFIKNSIDEDIKKTEGLLYRNGASHDITSKLVAVAK